MIEIWIPITIAAAFLQNVRSALQKHLRGQLSVSGATFVRFSFGFPLAILYLVGLMLLLDQPLPQPSARFAAFMTAGGIAQILATALLVSLFAQRNFAVGTTYSKTETVQTAIFGIIILGDHLSTGAAMGIVVSLAGVMTISLAKSETRLGAVLGALTSRSAMIGIASGSFFGISAVSYRAASLSLDGPGFLMQAAFTLACVTVLQTIVMAIYMRWREPGQIGRTLASWRTSIWVGASGVAASACWFTAMTIQNAAYVRALGQIELLFTLAAAHFFFRERATRLETIGIVLTVAGILWLLLST
ncbi:MAG: EamA family transporter [Alphaproteobacteria bacterium]